MISKKFLMGKKVFSHFFYQKLSSDLGIIVINVMDAYTTKIVVMLLLGGISILCGYIPIVFGKRFKNKDGTQKHKTFFSALLCFGGGVLLATTLLHILPEVKK